MPSRVAGRYEPSRRRFLPAVQVIKGPLVKEGKSTVNVWTNYQIQGKSIFWLELVRGLS